MLVPCCQAEVAAALRKHKAQLKNHPLSAFWQHPIHTREFGSHSSNVMRTLRLQALGYQVTVTELVGWEHSMKNELIVARRDGAPRGNAHERATQVIHELGLTDLASRFLY